MVSVKIARTTLFPLLFHALNITPLPIVTLPFNNITNIGTSTNNIDTFLEIPCGQDTSGQNRFAPPKPFIPAQIQYSMLSFQVWHVLSWLE
jgi:hypothetical protein